MNLIMSLGFVSETAKWPYYDEHYLGFWDTDVRHALVFSGGWDLPFDRAWQSGPKLLTKGWSLYPIFTWRTGFPLDVLAGLQATNTDPGPAGDGSPNLVRADLVLPNVATYNPRNQQTINGVTGNYFFNPAAFSADRLNTLDATAQTNAAALAGMFTEGTLGRNAIRGPGFVNLDISLAKHFKFFEDRLDAELRMDAFNAFNHTNFGSPSDGSLGTTTSPNTNINSSQFGQVSTTVSPRVVQLALHIRF